MAIESPIKAGIDVVGHDTLRWVERWGQEARKRGQFLKIGTRRSTITRMASARAVELAAGLQALFSATLVRMTTLLTRAQVIDRLVAAEPEIRALGVQRLALFGSVLRGDSTPASDVDLLVEFAPMTKTFDRFLALSELLEACLERHVDLVTTEALSPFIGPRILAEAQDVLRAA